MRVFHTSPPTKEGGDSLHFLDGTISYGPLSKVFVFVDRNTAKLRITCNINFTFKMKSRYFSVEFFSCISSVVKKIQSTCTVGVLR